jgi:hypothetical protein
MQKICHFVNCISFPFCRQTSAHDDSSLIDQNRTLEETAKSPDNESHMQLRHKNVIPDDEGTKMFAVSSVFIVYYNLNLPCKRLQIEVVCVWVCTCVY